MWCSSASTSCTGASSPSARQLSAAMTAEGETRHRSGRRCVSVQRLTYGVADALAHQFAPVGAADHDQRQQAGVASQPARRPLANTPLGAKDEHEFQLSQQ